MKKFTNFMMIAGLVILLSSCGVTTKRTMWASPADSPTMEIMNTIQADVVVDKSKTLSGTASHSVFLGIFKSGNNEFADLPGRGMSKTKEAAIFQALDGSNMDILVNPKFNVVVNQTLLSRKVTVSVEGHGGKYVIR